MPEHAVFDGSFDGFLCVVHAHYYDKLDPIYISERSGFQRTIGADYKFIETDYEKAERVFNSMREKISEDAAGAIYKAFLSSGPERFMNVYRYALLGFKKGAEVDSYMKLDYVLYTQKAAKYVGSETHLLTGFCRFTETKSGVLYAEIGPVNNVLPLLANHFSDRLMNEQWIILDTKRNTAAVYDGKEFVISEVPETLKTESAAGEEKYRDLWRMFYETIAVETRENPKLQRTHLPLRYRKYMTEFKWITKNPAETTFLFGKRTNDEKKIE